MTDLGMEDEWEMDGQGMVRDGRKKFSLFNTLVSCNLLHCVRANDLRDIYFH